MQINQILFSLKKLFLSALAQTHAMALLTYLIINLALLFFLLPFDFTKKKNLIFEIYFNH